MTPVEYEIWRTVFFSALEGSAAIDATPETIIAKADEIARLAMQKNRVEAEASRQSTKGE